MNEYEINEDTLALIPYKKNQTKVFELNNSFIVNKRVNKVMEESCEFFGSSLSGRQKGTEKLIGITHKVPVIVEESKKKIFFPTSSPRLEKCCWISLNNIVNYEKNEKQSIITFMNNKQIELNESFGIIDNQILRSTRLESVLRKRMQKD